MSACRKALVLSRPNLICLMHTLLSLLLLSGFLSFLLPESPQLVEVEESSQWYQPEQTLAQQNQEISFWQQKHIAAPNQLTYKLQLASAYEQRFATYGQIKDLKMAESLLAEGLEKASVQRIFFLRALARNYISQHRFQDALQMAEAAMEHSDSKMKSTYLLFDVFMELGRYEEAEALLVKMAAKPQFQCLIRKAKWEDHKGNLTFAIARLEEAKAQLNPQQQKGQAIWLYANLADFYGHAGRIEEAYQHYKMTLDLDPANWYAYKGLAWIAYAQDGNPAEARKIVHQVMRYNDSPDLHLFLAELYEFEGNSACAEAEQYAFQQTSTQPAYGHMYRIPNLELLLAAGQTQQATKLAQAEVQERPTSETYGFLSLALYRAGAVAEARELASNQVWEKTVEPVALLQLREVFPEDQKMQSFITEELSSAAFEIGPLTYQEIKSKKID